MREKSSIAPDAPPQRQDVFRTAPAEATRELGILAVIALGGGLGSVARYLVAQAIPAKAGHFPWATFVTNLSGCFALGLLMVLVLDVWPPRRYIRPFFGIGFLGGYTTFSTFAVELRALGAHGAWSLADAYALNSLVGGLAAVWIGMTIARLIAGLPIMRREGQD
jgi:CrcB protein